MTDKGLLTCLDAVTGEVKYEGGRVPTPATFTASLGRAYPEGTPGTGTSGPFDPSGKVVPAMDGFKGCVRATTKPIAARLARLPDGRYEGLRVTVALPGAKPPNP